VASPSCSARFAKFKPPDLPSPREPALLLGSVYQIQAAGFAKPAAFSSALAKSGPGMGNGSVQCDFSGKSPGFA